MEMEKIEKKIQKFFDVKKFKSWVFIFRFRLGLESRIFTQKVIFPSLVDILIGSVILK